MDRRLFLGGAMALAGAAKASAAGKSPLSLTDAARLAWLYGLPLIEVAEVRRRVLALGPANRLHHQRDLTTPATQRVTSPNNDTLYSRGFLELSQGPVVLTLPATGERYFSVALMDMFTNNFVVLGTRTTGPEGGRFMIAGPDGPAPAGAIRAPSNWVFVLGRTLVDGPQDIEQARLVQDGLRLEAPAGLAPNPAAFAPRTAGWRDYFTGLGALLAETTPPATDAGFFHAVKALGLTPTGFKPPTFSPEQEAEIAKGVSQAIALAGLANGGTYEAGGWTYPQSNLGIFEQDYLFRGQIAQTGLFALPVAEAMYTRSVGDDGQGLFRGDRYRLTFPKGRLLPVNGFWSLTVYRATPDGQFFLAPNAIDRSSIGDRTPGLTYGEDGSLDLWISRQDPGAERRSNWLPAPEGPFMLSLRAYLPQASLLTGQYRAPPVVALP